MLFVHPSVTTHDPPFPTRFCCTIFQKGAPGGDGVFFAHRPFLYPLFSTPLIALGWRTLTRLGDLTSIAIFGVGFLLRLGPVTALFRIKPGQKRHWSRDMSDGRRVGCFDVVHRSLATSTDAFRRATYY